MFRRCNSIWHRWLCCGLSLAPKLSKIFGKISNYIIIPICVVLVSLFIVDLIYSHSHPNMGEGVTVDSASIKNIHISKIIDKNIKMY